MGWGERMRRAAEARRELDRLPPEEAEALMAQAFARSGATRAEQTFRTAMLRNIGLGASWRGHDLPESVLDPGETVHEVLVGTNSEEARPLMLVTDRRVLATKARIVRGWKVLWEAPAGDIVGVDLEKAPPFALRVRVRLRRGKDRTFKVRYNERGEEVVAYLRHLLAGGAPGV